MTCAQPLTPLSSSQIAAIAAAFALVPNALYYAIDTGRVVVADTTGTYHDLAADGSGVEAIPALSGMYVAGQGRQFSLSASFTPIPGWLYGIPFAHRSVFSGLGLFVNTPGSSDSVARFGIYARTNAGVASPLVEDMGEYPMNVGGQRDFAYAANRFIDFPYFGGAVFGGTTMPVLAGHIASAEEGARIWGASDCTGPNPPITGIKVDLGGYPAAMPDPFPAGYAAVGVALGLGAKIA